METIYVIGHCYWGLNSYTQPRQNLLGFIDKAAADAKTAYLESLKDPGYREVWEYAITKDSVSKDIRDWLEREGIEIPNEEISSLAERIYASCVQAVNDGEQIPEFSIPDEILSLIEGKWGEPPCGCWTFDGILDSFGWGDAFGERPLENGGWDGYDCIGTCQEEEEDEEDEEEEEEEE